MLWCILPQTTTEPNLVTVAIIFEERSMLVFGRWRCHDLKWVGVVTEVSMFSRAWICHDFDLDLGWRPIYKVCSEESCNKLSASQVCRPQFELWPWLWVMVTVQSTEVSFHKLSLCQDLYAKVGLALDYYYAKIGDSNMAMFLFIFLKF